MYNRYLSGDYIKEIIIINSIITDKSHMAEGFHDFFSKGGIMTANEIEKDKNKSFNDYLHNPSFIFYKV